MARERGPKTRLGCRHAASMAASPRRAQQARTRGCWARTGGPCRAVRTLPIPCQAAQCCAPSPPTTRVHGCRGEARARLPPTSCRTPRCCQGLRPCWPRAQRESGASRNRMRVLHDTGGGQFKGHAPMHALPGSTRWPWPKAQRGVYVASAGGVPVGGRNDSRTMHALPPARHVRARRPQQPGRAANRGRQVWHAAARPQ